MEESAGKLKTLDLMHKKTWIWSGTFIQQELSGDKKHYYLIQIGHMISQIMEAWKKLWEKMTISISEKHKRIFESFKKINIAEYKQEVEKRFQIRFT